MDERAARRIQLADIVEKDSVRTKGVAVSGVVPANAGASAPSSVGITTGAVLDGKYVVGRIIGAGAVGVVFEAKNVELDETVAIKCLRPEMLVDAAVVARFAREAKASAALKSEYVATVHDVGTTPEGVPYIVMEYLDGKDLGAILTESGVFDPRTAVELALHVCEALAIAHAKGIVHRDIKPENLLLAERAGGMRVVKVLDFGISKMALTGSIFKNELPLVTTVDLMGTPLYMSPEQVRVSGSIDVRSDIWSLGMVLYEVLAGETAFSGQSITEICASILESPPRPLELYRRDLPPGLIDVVLRCLEKDVTKRYQNIAELALALMPFGPKRTRLNVERAVAVLQGSGHVDPHVRVSSSEPPPLHSMHPTAIPRPPRIPSIASVPSALSSVPMTAAISERALATSSPSLSADETLGSPAVKKKPAWLAMGALAVVVVGGALALTVVRSKSSSSADISPPTRGALPEDNGRAPALVTSNVAAAVAPSVRIAAEPILAPTTVEPARTAPTVGAMPAIADVAKAKPAGSPRTPASIRRSAGVGNAGAPNSATVVAKAKPTSVGSTAKPTEEPDLGY